MDRTLLDRFLSGNATPTERQQVETLLSESGTVIDECMVPGDSDSLIAAIQHAAAGSERAEPGEQGRRTAALIEHIQSLISRQAIGKDDLEKLLDPAERDEELGRISRYRVLEFIACGGMGLVFKANDPEINRDVCIKIMNPALAAHPDARMRFEREARAAARLHSERIVTVFEVGQHRQLPYLVMPLLAGESLRKRLQRDKRVEPRLACRMALQVAQGLRAAHAHGYLHRDIKPDNIWLTPDENVILLDLGLVQAKNESVDLTHSGTILGTPCYMSPEQVQGKPLQESSDLFSLGVVLFEMLTGVSPFDRDNVFSTMMSVAHDTLPIPLHTADNAIPSALVPIVRKLLAKEPAARLQTAEEVIQLLEPIASGQASMETHARGGSSWNRIKYLSTSGMIGSRLPICFPSREPTVSSIGHRTQTCSLYCAAEIIWKQWYGACATIMRSFCRSFPWLPSRWPGRLAAIRSLSGLTKESNTVALPINTRTPVPTERFAGISNGHRTVVFPLRSRRRRSMYGHSRQGRWCTRFPRQAHLAGCSLMEIC